MAILKSTNNKTKSVTFEIVESVMLTDLNNIRIYTKYGDVFDREISEHYSIDILEDIAKVI